MCILDVGSSLCTVSVGNIQNKLQVNTCEFFFYIACEAAKLMHAVLIRYRFYRHAEYPGKQPKIEAGFAGACRIDKMHAFIFLQENEDLDTKGNISMPKPLSLSTSFLWSGERFEIWATLVLCTTTCLDKTCEL